MKITEKSSNYEHIDQMPIADILTNINKEDKKVSEAVSIVIPEIEKFVTQLVGRMKNGGRLFYIGAGTSGRLGILDASEIPPTFGMPHERVIGLIAGGDKAIRKAVENAEDDQNQAWIDLSAYSISSKDSLVGIAASGTTPYVIGAVKKARQMGILTACICCNPDSQLAKEVEYPITPVVGPEFVTGSTRMKSGTAQKMVLNMISTTAMIQLGRVKGNKMVNMQLTNKKLVDRGTKMIVDELGISYEKANEYLMELGSVKKVIDKYR